MDGVGWPLRLAEVDMMGLRKRFISALQKGSVVTRMAMLPSLFTTLSGKLRALSYMTVVGVSKLSMIAIISGGGAATYCSMSRASASKTIMLFSLGRCLMAKTFSTAVSFMASQPIPQTVS